MDFPDTYLSSCYVREDIFGVILREQLRVYKNLGFRNIVLLNGHGAVGQVETINRISREFSYEHDINVISYFTLLDIPELKCVRGHATKLETSILMYMNKECTDLSALPSKEEEPFLSAQKYGMMDRVEYCDNSTDVRITDDPRDSMEEIGQIHTERAVLEISNAILQSIR